MVAREYCKKLLIQTQICFLSQKEKTKYTFPSLLSLNVSCLMSICSADYLFLFPVTTSAPPLMALYFRIWHGSIDLTHLKYFRWHLQLQRVLVRVQPGHWWRRRLATRVNPCHRSPTESRRVRTTSFPIHYIQKHALRRVQLSAHWSR